MVFVLFFLCGAQLVMGSIPYSTFLTLQQNGHHAEFIADIFW
jgi:hypothetical protein